MSRIEGKKGGSLYARLVFWVSQRTLGRVIEPLRIHAHSPGALWGMTQMQASQKAAKGLDPRLKLLAQLRVAQMVDCPF